MRQKMAPFLQAADCVEVRERKREDRGSAVRWCVSALAKDARHTTLHAWLLPLPLAPGLRQRPHGPPPRSCSVPVHVEAVEHHQLVPGADEVVHELLRLVVLGVILALRPKLRIGTEHQVHPRARPLARAWRVGVCKPRPGCFLTMTILKTSQKGLKIPSGGWWGDDKKTGDSPGAARPGFGSGAGPQATFGSSSPEA